MGRERDTAIGGPRHRFPATRLSAIAGVASDDPHDRQQAFATLVTHYWKPTYKYLRLKWHLGNEDAKDLTQGFFARALDRGTFAAFDPRKGSFRAFLRTCLDRYAANQHKAAGRKKRAAGSPLVRLDFAAAESELHEAPPAADLPADELFHREWVRSFFALAVAALEERLTADGKGRHFRLFERYDLEEATPRPTYADLAAELGIKVTDVTNHLAATRRLFRRIVLDQLAEVTASDEELRREARLLLGVEPP